MATINLTEVGAVISDSSVKFGLYLPGITDQSGVNIEAHYISEKSQFDKNVPSVKVPLNYVKNSVYDLWQSNTIDIESGKYFYRYKIAYNDTIVYFSDPFARDTGNGIFSAFENTKIDYEWTNHDFKVPELNKIIAYEIMVDDFNNNFDGIIARIPYLKSLNINLLELMPIYSINEPYDWGYTPIFYFSPEHRYGGSKKLKALIDACHNAGIAVILDMVYAHVSRDFPYQVIYDNLANKLNIKNPILSDYFEFGRKNDFRKNFTMDFFKTVNRFWLEEYNVDGFRYDHVNGYIDSKMDEDGWRNLDPDQVSWDNYRPSFKAYTELTDDIYEYSKQFTRFYDKNAGDIYSRILQVPEDLGSPKYILKQGSTTCCWHQILHDDAINLILNYNKGGNFNDSFGQQLVLYNDSNNPVNQDDPGNFDKWPTCNKNNNDKIPAAPFQFFDNHDKSRSAYVIESGKEWWESEYISGADSGFNSHDRTHWFKLQPYAIALMTCEGVPMLWQGQEFAETYGSFEKGYGRVKAAERLHWDYFYETENDNIFYLVKLYRQLSELRTDKSALRSRNSYYNYDKCNLDNRTIVYTRQSDDNDSGKSVIIFINFSDNMHIVNNFKFPADGTWTDQLEQKEDAVINQGEISQNASSCPSNNISVPSNYGRIFVLKTLQDLNRN